MDRRTELTVSAEIDRIMKMHGLTNAAEIRSLPAFKHYEAIETNEAASIAKHGAELYWSQWFCARADLFQQPDRLYLGETKATVARFLKIAHMLRKGECLSITDREFFLAYAPRHAALAREGDLVGTVRRFELVDKLKAGSVRTSTKPEPALSMPEPSPATARRPERKRFSAIDEDDCEFDHRGEFDGEVFEHYFEQCMMRDD